MAAQNIHILNINPGSDGDGRKWPKHHYVRNDEYFKEKIASEKWIKDLGGAQPGVTYVLDRLPQGYAGFERLRPDSKHCDRYIYGHPNGQFRSLNEFYPHFKHLMDNGGSVGCPCKNCEGIKQKKKPKATGVAKGSRTQGPSTSSARPSQGIQQNSESPGPEKRRLVDFEGTQDVYESLISQLKSDREAVIDVPIEEPTSPDWRSSHMTTAKLFREWQDLPRYVPRLGELVLFIRSVISSSTPEWDSGTRTFRYVDAEEGTWLEQPKWEAGIVTQMPQEPILHQDLITDEDKEQAVNYSGFRIEPLSEPKNANKPYTKQPKHVPLYAIRPFVYWRECLIEQPEEEWHPTIKHALTVSSSFCIVGRHRFRGLWPDATVFCSGVYIGPELITLGDAVRLLPRKQEQKGDAVTEVMVVDAIRLRFVNLDNEEDDMAPEEIPYQTCLHLSGRVYTLDPARSFDGVGKVPIDERSSYLPLGVTEYGSWYHYVDPDNTAARVEVPYTRVLGRCFEETAIDAWFGTSSDTPAPSTPKPDTAAAKEESDITRGLLATLTARRFSQKHDKRIQTEEGQTWFWADTRIEQLDLHEVNGRFIGAKDPHRTPGEMRKWRAAIKAMDGKKGALEEYHAVKQAQEAEQQVPTPSSKAYGMVAASRMTATESPSAPENVDDGDAMDVDEEEDEGEAVERSAEQSSEEMEVEEIPRPLSTVPKTLETINLLDSDDEDEEEAKRLAGELAKSIRAGDSRLR
ncbi:hypothetical protein BDY17DRAFT_297681 [Neohortaea acidophila]|uniref:Cryptic loci regulator 2 N-terminal domain-containing protein n=1 Tax=Neohortaea acidophila TaxID=245834 RepID=A0A6A6PUZ4_9PEZI|nr:uncharacterized protein BDY17DRAFT_297681 [Neohortaea acidophila]KAF2483596.1 hypothetical protein BDY17DRAFT_297681 [Neohortaea acidophila]